MTPPKSSALVGRSSAIQRILEDIKRLGPTTVPVLLQGETGTGKEVVARLLHDESERTPFIAVNCAAIPDGLFEGEMFGFEKGAFTGARRIKEGLLEEADGGTLFLDEVGDLSLHLQAKLLRAVENGEVRRLGSTRSRWHDFRMIAATNKDLAVEVQRRGFRTDLYWRLRYAVITLPPLRERLEDIPLLLRHLAPGRRCTPQAISALQSHDWPGNVRELRHAIELALIYSDGDDIDVEHLPHELPSRRPGGVQASSPASVRPLRGVVAEFERKYIRRALEVAGGENTRAAELLGIDRKTLWRKLRDGDTRQ